jgi:hypothetical protein
VKQRLLAFLIIALLTSSVWQGCGDEEEPLTVDEYFARLAELDEAHAQEMARLDEELSRLATNDVQGGVDVLERQTELRAQFADALDRLAPPEEARVLHDGTVARLRAAVDAYRDYAEKARDAKSIIEMLTLFKDVDFDAINGAIAKCQELEQFAQQHAITIDLSCDE